MPVWVLKNEAFGNMAFCTLNEGLGKVLRYGAYSDPVIQKLKWMEDVLYPVLKKAIAKLGTIDLKNLIAQALHEQGPRGKKPFAAIEALSWPGNSRSRET